MLTDKYFEEMPKFKDMQYWFYKRPGGVDVIHIETGDKETADLIFPMTLKLDEQTKFDIEDVNADWETFKLRPEYTVGIIPSYKSETDMEDIYEKMLLGASLIKMYDKLKSDPDEYIMKIKTKCLDWLRTTDFYTCPASTQYHESHDRGLLLHSLRVVDRIVGLMMAPPFDSLVTYESAVFVALVHDWCKIGLYTSYMRNVKNEETGKWEQVKSYKYVEDRAIALGHGVSSMFLAMKFYNLSIEEASAIRYHMGHWNCVDAELNELQQANRKYPLVHLLQFADQLSIVNY